MRWIILLFILKASLGQLQLGSSSQGHLSGGAMMNMAQITKLDVDCGKEGMTVNVEFSQPFNGIIFSKGHFNDPSCRYVSATSGKTSYTFDIPSQNCGTEMDDSDNAIKLSNVLVVQNDENIQEIWDIARRVTCSWVENFVKNVKFDPFAVGMLNAEEVVFEGGDTIDCWMDIQLGVYPNTREINSIVQIGEEVSLLIYLRDKAGSYDVNVKDCYAYGSSNYEGDVPKVQLTNEDGCVIKDKLISDFTKQRDNDILVTHATMNAFKFPDVMEVYMSCNMEICKGQCENTCIVKPTEAPRISGSTLFGEPIYTKAPDLCPPGSQRPECIPPTVQERENCVQGSSDPACSPPQKPEPSNQKPFECQPGSTDPKCQTPAVSCEDNPNHPDCLKCKQGSSDPKCKGSTQFPDRCYPGSKNPNCIKLSTTTPPKCYPGSIDPRCPKLVTQSPPNCYPGSHDPRCPKINIKPGPKCYPGSRDPKCRKTSPASRPKCSPGSKDPKCQISNCLPNSKDPRCVRPTTAPLTCYPGSVDPRCRTHTKPSITKCYPGSSDPKCKKQAKPPSKCRPGSIDPRCVTPTAKPFKCIPGSIHPQCITKDIDSFKCRPGSNDPRCETLIGEPSFQVCREGSIDPRCREESPDTPCLPGSKNPRCRITTDTPKRGSVLFPGSQTTTKASKIFPDNSPTTTVRPRPKPKPTPRSPSLKPAPSNTVKNNINSGEKEPKPKPEPSGKEWEGEARYHAFHSFHYDKGDGRRRNRGRRSLKSKNTSEKKLLKVGRGILVSSIESTETETRVKREIMNLDNVGREPITYMEILPKAEDVVCLSVNTLTIGVSVLILGVFSGVVVAVIISFRSKPQIGIN